MAEAQCAGCKAAFEAPARVCGRCGLSVSLPQTPEDERAVLREWHTVLVWALEHQASPEPGRPSTDTIVRQGIIPNDPAVLVEEVEFTLGLQAQVPDAVNDRVSALLTRLELLSLKEPTLRRSLEVLRAAHDRKASIVRRDNRVFGFGFLALVGGLVFGLMMLISRCVG